MGIQLPRQCGSQYVKEAVRLASIRLHSPAGTIEQDDMDNWLECTSTSRGIVGRSLSLNNQMGMGHEKYDPGLWGWFRDHAVSENNHRRFYQR